RCRNNMSKQKPNIITPFNDRQRIKDLVNEVIDDTFISTHTPDSVTLSEFISLTLANKKFVFQDVAVDGLEDYVDVYLTGLKQKDDSYSVTDDGTNLVISFTESLGLDDSLFTASDFEVKGKIVSR
ncbi:MAG: hypothetical protein ACPH0A_08165, partial [Candidatus Poseidoniaceae archaeon]